LCLLFTFGSRGKASMPNPFERKFIVESHGPGLCTQTRHSPANIAKSIVFTDILCSGLWVCVVSIKEE
jgi:hypothetical protein